jgi:hypothetical protein
VLTTTDSNVWGGASGHTYTLSRLPDGGTSIEVVVVREGKNFKGRAFEVLVRAFGKRKLTRDLAKTVKAIEARSSA